MNEILDVDFEEIGGKENFAYNENPASYIKGHPASPEFYSQNESTSFHSHEIEDFEYIENPEPGEQLASLEQEPLEPVTEEPRKPRNTYVEISIKNPEGKGRVPAYRRQQSMTISRGKIWYNLEPPILSIPDEEGTYIKTTLSRDVRRNQVVDVPAKVEVAS
jgi:hypothetical protein